MAAHRLPVSRDRASSWRHAEVLPLPGDSSFRAARDDLR
ncbi:hypothetical protein LI90_1408 [Carbonactinospora thermoautotrophica]|uniref:Uncharacterized protein n=1 Tax=Carbonactinospora thermoautotrophica TaxID=1469144 RepID=A0A132MPX2_9ACTN|nr:hypothetical protein LI90_1408 [Carbonactinospora thermoautotrophica]